MIVGPVETDFAKTVHRANAAGEMANNTRNDHALHAVWNRQGGMRATVRTH
jgi:hypothetical protein